MLIIDWSSDVCSADLFEECYDGRTVVENAWLREDGRWVDSLRPQIEPAGFESAEAVEHSRKSHIECAREAFESCDIFVFTLGLTETWRSRVDGTVFPVASSEEHTSELQSLMRISYAVFCLKKKIKTL